ncbi:hypothetical protein JX266_005809 [Neoarthrinium moseri]|uniref:uncharacterized protein n=1 Tax=Neoarthrinium moseri TaxID=1658444 RepID=UPI001FDCD03A|nr:uncharacterized protein JN550_008807 [Neoarthrinium moseri]KAI1848503.1 hypothetical protein JX266_005809 [Neoarthrinium moseri]KAI1864520.1 hypothetical protein JN550_008807 [Neoarthrinium moseri]
MTGFGPLWPESSHNVEPLASEVGEVVKAAAAWANEMQHRLTGIHYNTSQFFFWTMFASIATLGLIMLRTLNSLFYQLQELNAHQATYKDMWVEERQGWHQQIVKDEEARDGLIYQLQELNHHQARYREMWVDERKQMWEQIGKDESTREHMFSQFMDHVAPQGIDGQGGKGKAAGDSLYHSAAFRDLVKGLAGKANMATRSGMPAFSSNLNDDPGFPPFEEETE